MVIPILDGDILAYELSFAADAFWKYSHAEKGEVPTDPPPFDVVQEMIERRIPEIIQESGATGVPEMCFTGSGNFRNFIAFTKPYKANRNEKPFHYKNTLFVLKLMYKHHVVNGLEADDLMGILMTANPGRYICISRDKDLRQIAGHHYGWEVHNQPAFGPYEYDYFGEIALTPKKKIVGGGMKFFYCQLLMGDSVDTVPGIAGTGPVTAYAIINPCNTVEECEAAVAVAYQKAYGLDWLSVMREQGRLLHMTRRVDKNKNVLLWGLQGEPEVWINYQTGEVRDS